MMKRTMILTVGVAAVCTAALAQDSVTPAIRDVPYWLSYFDARRAAAEKEDFDVVFLGDSITHNWESAGTNVWAANFAEGPYRALNCGIWGDRTEQLLWRIEHDQLAGRQPKVIVLMIGTNNTGHRDLAHESPTDTILGIQSVVESIKSRFPYTKIVLHPIFPRGATTDDPLRVRNDLVNSAIRQFADGERVLWCDFNARLLTADGVLETSMSPDLLHPAERGYEIWAEELKPYLDFALGRSASSPKPSCGPAPTAVGKELPRTVRPEISKYWLQFCKFDERRRMFEKRAAERANADGYYDAIWLGDSITHLWETDWTGGPTVFREKFGNYKILNAAFGGDKVENTLWNIRYGGFLDGVRTRIVSLMVGTNNTWGDSAEDIAAGIGACVKAIREKQPQAKVLLFALLPREVAHDRGNRKLRRENANVDEILPKIGRINELIRGYADGKDVLFVDLTGEFTDAAGQPDIRLLIDGTHPSSVGYAVMADALLPIYRKILGR